MAWIVNVFGTRLGNSWEISVVEESNKHGQRSYGWFDDQKLLVSHNGGPCQWPICGLVWDRQIEIANELRDKLNAGMDVGAIKTTQEAKDMER